MIDSQLSRAVRERMADEELTMLVEVDRALGLADNYLGKFLRGDQASLGQEAREALFEWLGWARKAFDLVYSYHQRKARRRRGKQYNKRQEKSRLADIEGATFPLPLVNGTICQEPLSVEKERKCTPKGCAVYEECQRSLWTEGVILCERPLEREMVPEMNRNKRAHHDAPLRRAGLVIDVIGPHQEEVR